jgi:diguanylate cyclase (GGDEF)-like protein
VPTTSFVAEFVPVALLALLVAALLSATQIRRTLGPLHALLAGTRRAAEQDFSSRVDTEEVRDEFGELGAAFNAMNERLGRQFETLRTLADIDRGILTRSAVDCTVEMVLQRLRPLLAARFVAVAMLDRHGGAALRVFVVDASVGGPPSLERLDAGACDALAWVAAARETRIDDAAREHPILRALPLSGANVLVSVPILADTAPAGALIAAFDGVDVLSAEQHRHLRELADRLGVAFATAAKDEELYYQAHFDSLTTLPNRLQFMEELGRRMAHARREQREVALLFIDLDHFKDINDTAGHALGDAVLREAADRLRHCVRSGDALARLGGDEFTVIVSDMSTPRTPELVAGHVLDAMAVPFACGGGEHFLSASIGIAIHPADGVTPEELLRNADTAMYRAKEAGRNRSVYYEERMNAAAQARVNIERDLRRGLEAAEFQLVYQPQFELATGRLVAAEALLRWHHRDGSILMPGEFIGRAEETGVIERLGLWVLQEACRQHQQWASEGLVLDRIALNVSPQQLRRRQFVGEVATALRGAGMPARCLELEITESVLMDPGRHVELALATLDSMRVRVALDDFGTGYSSLAYVKRFPVHVVKIDRAFIADLHREASSLAISRAIIGMAHALGKSVVAEGVENAAQAALLQELACDYVQGFHFGQPLEPAEFAAMIRRRAAVDARSPADLGAAGRRAAASGAEPR